MRRLAPLLVALLLGACSHRARLNPLDSANPESGGAPEGFNALADFLQVQLVWTPRPDLPIDGFKLFRLAPFDSVYRPLAGVLPPTAGRFRDTNGSNGLDFRYRLYYVVDGVTSTTFAEDVATPGSVRAWVGDVGAGRLLRLTPDARDVLTSRTGFASPYSLAVTPDFGPVWVADFQAGLVSVADPSGLIAEVVIRGVPQPFTMALDPFDASAWICDLAGSVRHYAQDGRPASPSSIQFLEQPGGVATDPADGSLWVTESAGDRVRRFLRDGTPDGVHLLPSPSRVAVDSLTGEAWVTSLSSGRVWRLSNRVDVLDSLQLSGPIGVALDWRRRTAWVADAAANLLVAIDMDAAVVRLRITVPGEPRDVAVDLERGEAWVVARTAGAVARYSASGVLLGRVTGLGNPYEVRLDRGFQ
jgi:DNA-binding beta-propeller fold protein YncE